MQSEWVPSKRPKTKKVSSNAEELKEIQDIVDEQLKVSQDNVENGTHNKVPEPKVATEEKIEEKNKKKGYVESSLFSLCIKHKIEIKKCHKKQK